jgi:chromosome segregation ATPase
LALVDENANLRGIGNDARHGHRECQDRLNRLTDEATLLREELKLEKETRTRLHSDLMEEQEESTRQIASLGSQYSTQVDTLHREFQQERERLEGELRAASLERDDARRTIDRLRRETAEIQGRLTETDARRQADQDALRRCRDDGVQREAAWQSEWIRHRSEQNACAQALLNCVEARERTALEVQAADDAYDLVRTAPQPKRARTGATVDLDTFWSGMFLEPSARVFSAVDEGGL